MKQCYEFKYNEFYTIRIEKKPSVEKWRHIISVFGPYERGRFLPGCPPHPTEVPTAFCYINPEKALRAAWDLVDTIADGPIQRFLDLSNNLLFGTPRNPNIPSADPPSITAKTKLSRGKVKRK
jgi:hypothetical protein